MCGPPHGPSHKATGQITYVVSWVARRWHVLNRLPRLVKCIYGVVRLVTSLVGEGQLRGNYGSGDRGEAPTPEAGRGLGDQGNFLSSRGKVLQQEHKL